MEKFYTKIIGSPVSDDDVRPITTVQSVIMDPESGKLAALQVGYGKNMVVLPMDILSWQDIIKIHSHDSIIEANEVLKIDELMKKDIQIFRNRVESQEGDYVGRVYDYSIDPKSLSLKNLYIAKDILGLFRYNARIIRSKDIIEILKDKIIIKNDLETVKEEIKSVGVEEMAKA